MSSAHVYLRLHAVSVLYFMWSFLLKYLKIVLQILLFVVVDMVSLSVRAYKWSVETRKSVSFL